MSLLLTNIDDSDSSSSQTFKVWEQTSHSADRQDELSDCSMSKRAEPSESLGSTLVWVNKEIYKHNCKQNTTKV